MKKNNEESTSNNVAMENFLLKQKFYGSYWVIDNLPTCFHPLTFVENIYDINELLLT